ncbi:MAG: hypothetical protein WCT49_02865 [Candidatus Paceibacterota bacterium]|jgi:hypothetical protein|nr:hypothetical protein [Candidatus Paceibacterota bacterium]
MSAEMIEKPKIDHLFDEEKIIMNGKSVSLRRCNVNSRVVQYGSDINGRIRMDEFLRMLEH